MGRTESAGLVFSTSSSGRLYHSVRTSETGSALSIKGNTLHCNPKAMRWHPAHRNPTATCQVLRHTPQAKLKDYQHSNVFFFLNKSNLGGRMKEEKNNPDKFKTKYNSRRHVNLYWVYAFLQ